MLADEVAQQLLQKTPGLSACLGDEAAIDERSLRHSLETVLLDVLSSRQPGAPDTGGPACQSGLEAPHQDGLQPSGTTAGEEQATPPDQTRQALFHALADARATPPQSLPDLAEAAGWPLPPVVRGVVMATPGETQQVAALLGDSLTGMFAGRPCLLVPSHVEDARARLELPMGGRLAAVGHEVPLKDTPSSLRWAHRLLALTPDRGVETRPVFVEDHFSSLLLLQDEPLTQALAAHWLRPLGDLTSRQSERLEATLLAWFEGGGAPEAAKSLSVHPQTIRYRMRQLEKLFGPQLRDPRIRFELELILRSRRLMAQARIVQARMAYVRQGRRRSRAFTANPAPDTAEAIARVNGL
ncbi:PucR family transcriptional regulator [Streptomyces yangpuensis]|uniref:PucR family transcriptional regulator n=1 Tax=Streptomyces yangpuensis TaxID=1648182 RepID=UPI00362DBEB6